MKKFILISICISAALAPLITADEEISCKRDFNINICGHSGILTSVNLTADYQKNPWWQFDKGMIWLDLDGFSSIAPYAVRNLALPYKFIVSYSKYEYLCSPRVIDFVPESFDALPLVKNVQLRCMKFTVKPNLLRGFASITVFRLETVDITGDLQEILVFPNLETLELENVNSTAISPSAFSKINPELKTIKIYGRRTIVESKSFERFHKLTSLTLQKIQMNDLPIGMFDGLDRLDYLELRETNITLLRGNVFEKLANLRKLFLEDNKISEVEPEAFFGLNKIYWLSLDKNELQRIPVGICHNLHNVNRLTFKFNKIKTIPTHAFDGCVTLSDLALDNNEIHSIKPSAFQGLDLRYLSLTNNHINVLKENTFNGLHYILQLLLSGNNITIIEQQAFKNMTSPWPDMSEVVLTCPQITEVDREKWGLDDSIYYIYLNNHRYY